MAPNNNNRNPFIHQRQQRFRSKIDATFRLNHLISKQKQYENISFSTRMCLDAPSLSISGWQSMPGGVTTQLATAECEEQLDLVRQLYSHNITEQNRAIAAPRANGDM